jgi:hypothetical protein
MSESAGTPTATLKAGSTPAAAPLFQLGQVVATPGALAAAEEHLIDVDTLLARHERADWGELPVSDAAANTAALRDGERLLSSYGQGEAKLWIITEADRSVTTVLRPEDY